MSNKPFQPCLLDGFDYRLAPTILFLLDSKVYTDCQSIKHILDAITTKCREFLNEPTIGLGEDVFPS